jgi:hypothetical protein
MACAGIAVGSTIQVLQDPALLRSQMGRQALQRLQLLLQPLQCLYSHFCLKELIIEQCIDLATGKTRFSPKMLSRTEFVE